MARGIEAGGKIRIEGREFTVENVLDNAVGGQRSIVLQLRWEEPVIEDNATWDRDVPEDEKPETFDLSSAAVLENVDLSAIMEQFKASFKDFSIDVESLGRHWF